MCMWIRIWISRSIHMFRDDFKAHIGRLQCKRCPICVSSGIFLQCVHREHERWSQWILLGLLKKTLLTFVRMNKSLGNRFCSAMNESDSRTFCVIFTQNWMNNFIFGTNTVALIFEHYLKLSSLQVERVFTLFVCLFSCLCMLFPFLFCGRWTGLTFLLFRYYSFSCHFDTDLCL